MTKKRVREASVAARSLVRVHERRAEASALLMREVVCEQVYRQRAAWNVEHPNNSLGVREIAPRDVAAAAIGALVDLTPKAMRQLAGEILNEPDPARWPDVVLTFLARVIRESNETWQ